MREVTAKIIVNAPVIMRHVSLCFIPPVNSDKPIIAGATNSMIKLIGLVLIGIAV